MIKRIMSVVVILGLLFFVVSAHAEQARYASVVKIKGIVQVKEASVSDWSLAKEGMILHQNDEIRTDKDSQAQLLLDKDGSTGQIELKEQTRLKLNTLIANEDKHEKTTLLDVAIGRVMVHVEKLKGDSKFEINTPTSTMGVRGTTFEVEVEDKDVKKTK